MKKIIYLVIAIISICNGYSQIEEELFGIGLFKIKIEDYKCAIADFNKIIEIDPTNAEAYSYRGVAQSSYLQDERGAIADYNKAIKLDPSDSFNYYNRGNAKLKLEDYRGAIKDYSKMIEIDPTDENAYFFRGYCKMRLNKFKEAIKDYDKTIKLNPTFGCAYFQRGLSKIAKGDKENGCLDLSQAGEMGLSDAYESIRLLCN